MQKLNRGELDGARVRRGRRVRCGGRMRLLAAIQPPDATQAILECLDLPTRAPPVAAALPDPDDAEGWPGDLEATL